MLTFSFAAQPYATWRQVLYFPATCEFFLQLQSAIPCPSNPEIPSRQGALRFWPASPGSVPPRKYIRSFANRFPIADASPGSVPRQKKNQSFAGRGPGAGAAPGGGGAGGAGAGRPARPRGGGRGS